MFKSRIFESLTFSLLFITVWARPGHNLQLTTWQWDTDTGEIWAAIIQIYPCSYKHQRRGADYWIRELWNYKWLWSPRAPCLRELGGSWWYQLTIKWQLTIRANNNTGQQSVGRGDDARRPWRQVMNRERMRVMMNTAYKWIIICQQRWR